MVTIFDMVTGELLHSDATSSSTATPARDCGMLAPRLQTVEEAVAAERRHSGMPADLLDADVGCFVDAQ